MCNYLQKIDDDIYLYEDKLPDNVNAMVMPGNNGDYTICLNQSLSDDAKKIVIEHEKQHIRDNDWACCNAAVEKEKVRKNDGAR